MNGTDLQRTPLLRRRYSSSGNDMDYPTNDFMGQKSKSIPEHLYLLPLQALLLLIVLLAGAAIPATGGKGRTPPPARALPPAPAQEGFWVVETVDDNYYVGYDTSIDVDPGNEPMISYHDNFNGALKYARRSGGSWQTWAVDSNGHTGEYTSLVLDPGRMVHISYFDHTNGSLKHAQYNGMVWQTEVVDDFEYTGLYTSLALDAAGRPHISYVHDASEPYPMPQPGALDYGLGRPEGIRDLYYAWFDGTAWQIETVASSIGTGSGYSSLALDATGTPHISFYNSNTGDLRYARRDGATWQVVVVDTPSAGTYNSLALDASGVPHIAYTDDSNYDLKYASYVGSGGNCGPANDWLCETVDSTGYVGAYCSLALDRSDRPHISYFSTYDGYSVKYAHWIGPGGNCGPANDWLCETADDSPAGVGMYTSLALDAYDLPHISYGCFCGGLGHALMYAYQPCIAPGEVQIAGPAVLLVRATGLYSATYTPLTATLPMTFSWDNGSLGPTAAYSWTAPGLYPITVTAANRCGATQAAFTVTVCQPVEQVTPSGPAFLTTRQTGLYSATYAPPTATLPVTWTWDNGTAGPTAAYSWTMPGTYTVAVTAANLCSQVSGTLAVDVCQPVEGAAIDGPSLVFISQSVSYAAGPRPLTATLPITFTWHDGTVGPTAVYSWTLPGFYTLTVTATNRCGEAPETIVVTVTDCWPVSSVQIDGPLTLPAGVGAPFTATAAPISASLPIIFTWDNGAVGASATYSWTVPGTRTLAVTATSYCGEAHGSYTVSVFCQELAGVAIAGPAALPMGSSGIYTATHAPITASLPLTWTWSNGTAGPTASYSWTVPGSYTLAVSATNLCSQQQATWTVGVFCRPVETATITGPGSLLAGQAGIYTATTSPPTASLPITFTWDNGMAGPTAGYSWTLPGDYTVIVTVTNWCQAVTARLPVVVRPIMHYLYLPLVFRQ